MMASNHNQIISMPKPSALKTIIFHVLNLLQGVFCLILFAVTFFGCGLLSCGLFMGTSRPVQNLVALLWRIELSIMKFYPLEDHIALERFRSRMEVTSSAMAWSIFYFLWFKGIFNIVFSSIPLVLWQSAFNVLLQSNSHPVGSSKNFPFDSSASPSGPTADGNEAGNVVTRIFLFVAFGLLGYHVGDFSASYCANFSHKACINIFGISREDIGSNSGNPLLPRTNNEMYIDWTSSSSFRPMHSESQQYQPHMPPPPHSHPPTNHGGMRQQMPYYDEIPEAVLVSVSDQQYLSRRSLHKADLSPEPSVRYPQTVHVEQTNRRRRLHQLRRRNSYGGYQRRVIEQSAPYRKSNIPHESIPEYLDLEVPYLGHIIHQDASLRDNSGKDFLPSAPLMGYSLPLERRASFTTTTSRSTGEFNVNCKVDRSRQVRGRKAVSKDLKEVTLHNQDEIAPDSSVPRQKQSSGKHQAASEEKPSQTTSQPAARQMEVPTYDDFQVYGRYRDTVSSDGVDDTFEAAQDYHKVFDMQFVHSPTVVTSLDTGPVYRSHGSAVLDPSQLGTTPVYDSFSPLNSPSSFSLSPFSSIMQSTTGYQQFNYDTLSPRGSSLEEKEDEFVAELPTVYRSIRYTPSESQLISRYSFQNSAEHLVRRDKVHFNAYAPPCVYPSKQSFKYAVWAFLLNQKDEMREKAVAEEPNAHQISVSTKLEVRKGARVHVTLEVPNGFRILNGSTQGFVWEGKVTRALYDIECTDNVIYGQVLIKATIVVGQEVAILRSYLFVGGSNRGANSTEQLEPEMLHSELEVLEKSFIEIPYQSLELKELVGKGYFGDAYKALLNGEEVVVKTIRASEFGETNDQIIKEFQHEAAVLSMFGHHPCIVPFVGASTNMKYPLSLVTKYLPYGSLEDQLRGPSVTKELTFSQKTTMLKDAASGLLNIHEGGFVHRDIAARNCLLDDNMRVKICDFGLTRRVNSYGGSLVREGVGPLKYMAPESFQPPYSFSFRSDSYMYGVLMWETYTMKAPFASMTPFQAAVRVLEGQTLDIPIELPEKVRNLMASCFNEDPSKRPSMAKILTSLEDASVVA